MKVWYKNCFAPPILKLFLRPCILSYDKIEYNSLAINMTCDNSNVHVLFMIIVQYGQSHSIKQSTNHFIYTFRPFFAYGKYVMVNEHG